MIKLFERYFVECVDHFVITMITNITEREDLFILAYGSEDININKSITIVRSEK